MTSRKLPVFESRQAELETCAYCPKLCRAACPVSEAEWSESVTPWGKMSSAFVTLRAASSSRSKSAAAPLTRGGAEPELIALDPEVAALPWACTGCFACRERCDHRNPVRDTLFEARATYLQSGVAPPGAQRISRQFEAQRVVIEERLAALEREFSATPAADTELLLGCNYLGHQPAAARSALQAARNLFGSVRLVSGCCGAGLDAAGDTAGSLEQRRRLLAALDPRARHVAVDAGCAYALRDAGFVPFSRAALEALGSGPSAPTLPGAELRYHDSCMLGRGLGEYQAPRELLRLALGAEPLEFKRNREFAACSGGGGLLPVTRPGTSHAIAKDRVLEHSRLGGGKVVTACAQSLRSLKKAGAEVIDLTQIVLGLSEK